jgi:hypothetical protein
MFARRCSGTAVADSTTGTSRAARKAAGTAAIAAIAANPPPPSIWNVSSPHHPRTGFPTGDTFCTFFTWTKYSTFGKNPLGWEKLSLWTWGWVGGGGGTQTQTSGMTLTKRLLFDVELALQCCKFNSVSLEMIKYNVVAFRYFIEIFACWIFDFVVCKTYDNDGALEIIFSLLREPCSLCRVITSNFRPISITCIYQLTQMKYRFKIYWTLL